MTFSESKIHTRERDASLYDYGMGDWT